MLKIMGTKAFGKMASAPLAGLDIFQNRSGMGIFFKGSEPDLTSSGVEPNI